MDESVTRRGCLLARRVSHGHLLPGRQHITSTHCQTLSLSVCLSLSLSASTSLFPVPLPTNQTLNPPPFSLPVSSSHTHKHATLLFLRQKHSLHIDLARTSVCLHSSNTTRSKQPTSCNHDVVDAQQPNHQPRPPRRRREQRRARHDSLPHSFRRRCARRPAYGVFLSAVSLWLQIQECVALLFLSFFLSFILRSSPNTPLPARADWKLSGTSQERH